MAKEKCTRIQLVTATGSLTLAGKGEGDCIGSWDIASMRKKMRKGRGVFVNRDSRNNEATLRWRDVNCLIVDLWTPDT